MIILTFNFSASGTQGLALRRCIAWMGLQTTARYL